MKKLFAVLLSVLVLGLGVSFAQTDADVSEEGVSVEIAPEEGVDFRHHPVHRCFASLSHRPSLRSRRCRSLRCAIPTCVSASRVTSLPRVYRLGCRRLCLTSLNWKTTSSSTVVRALALAAPLSRLSPSFALSGFVGGEYRFNRELGFFAELGTGISVIPFRPDIRGVARYQLPLLSFNRKRSSGLKPLFFYALQLTLAAEVEHVGNRV